MSDSGIFGHFDDMGGKKKRRRRKPAANKSIPELFDDLKLPIRKKSKRTTKSAGFDRCCNNLYAIQMILWRNGADYYRRNLKH
jgi:hypothetical protein